MCGSMRGKFTVRVDGNIESVPTTVLPENDSTETPSDYETAISATGYGMFNVLLILATIPVGWTAVFDTSTIAFVIPSAECDLELDLFRKGTLAAVTFAGMLFTAFLWGFVADNIGRKYLLLSGLFLDALCNIFSSAAQNYWVFLCFKFVNGIIVGGPFAVLMTYIAELHGESHRPKALMWTGSLFAVGNFAVPALSRAILPQPWTFSIFNNLFVFNEWRIFLLFSSLPPVLGILTVSVLPESPKFLMTRGKSEDALRIFRRIYSMNTGKSADTYPIKVLSRENVGKPRAPLEPTISSTRSLFAAPYLIPALLVNLIIFASMSGMHIMKSWLPQLIVILNNFDPEEGNATIIAPTVCEKLNYEAINAFPTETAQSMIGNTTETCIPMVVSSLVYTNAAIIAASAVLGGFLAGMVINKFGKKNMLLLSLFSAGMSNVAINWSPSTQAFLILASFSIALTGISTNTVTAMIVEVFPTNLRASAVSLTVIMGRLGALTGNLLFPILLNVSCDAPFYYIGGFLTLATLLAIFLSKPSEKS